MPSHHHQTVPRAPLGPTQGEGPIPVSLTEPPRDHSLGEELKMREAERLQDGQSLLPTLMREGWPQAQSGHHFGT